MVGASTGVNPGRDVRGGENDCRNPGKSFLYSAKIGTFFWVGGGRNESHEYISTFIPHSYGTV